MAQKQALLVAVDEYPSSRLDFCVKDALAIQSALLPFGFVSELLLDRASETVREKLTHYSESLEPGDTFLFYFAGHGMHDGSHSYLQFADAGSAEKPGALALAEIAGLLDTALAAQKILICDACRNPAAMARGASELPGMTNQMFSEFQQLAKPRDIRPREGQADRSNAAVWHVFLSCSAGERSWEDSTLQHGVFSHHLFSSLDRFATTLQRADVSMGEVAAEVNKNIGDWSAKHAERKMNPYSTSSGNVMLWNRGFRPPLAINPNRISVPAGEVLMDGRKVRIEEFMVSSHPITVGAYERSVALPRTPPTSNKNWAKKNVPMNCVSWNGASEWCRKNNAKLPAEAHYLYLRELKLPAVLLVPNLQEWCSDIVGSDANWRVARGLDRNLCHPTYTDEKIGFRCIW